MDLGKTIAAMPWLRRLWRLLPGPLKLPLLVVAVFMWWRRRGQDDQADAPGAGPSGDEQPR